MKEHILDCACQLSRRKGFGSVTRISVADMAGCAEGTVSYHFRTMRRLHDAVVAAAVKREDLVIIAQALSAGHRLAKIAPQPLKDRAAKLISA